MTIDVHELADRDVYIRTVVEALQHHFPVQGDGDSLVCASTAAPWPCQDITRVMVLRYAHPYLRAVNAILEDHWPAELGSTTVCAIDRCIWPCPPASNLFLGPVIAR